LKSSVRSAVVFFVAVGCALALTSRSSNARPSYALCGAEGWTVKTLKDRPALVPAKLVTVRYLVTRRAPAFLPARRLAFERRVFTVFAAVTLVRPEADGDFRVLLQDRGFHIAEAPMPSCTAGANPAMRHAIAVARSHVRLCRRAKVTGVAFFDFKRGQTGVAPNAMELHPILGFHCLAG
jgi:hypothetical protein